MPPSWSQQACCVTLLDRHNTGLCTKVAVTAAHRQGMNLAASSAGDICICSGPLGMVCGGIQKFVGLPQSGQGMHPLTSCLISAILTAQAGSGRGEGSVHEGTVTGISSVLSRAPYYTWHATRVGNSSYHLQHAPCSSYAHLFADNIPVPALVPSLCGMDREVASRCTCEGV